jgi:hypothetical protein
MCGDGVRIQVNQLTSEEVHNGNQEFAGRKAKPSNKMRFKTNHGGAIYHGGVGDGGAQGRQ